MRQQIMRLPGRLLSGIAGWRLPSGTQRRQPAVTVNSRLLSTLKNYDIRPSNHPIIAVLEERIASLVDEKRQTLQTLKKQFGKVTVSTATVKTITTGMRNLTCLLSETSALDAEKGIRFRKYTIDECIQKLPSASSIDKSATSPLSESILWLLLTGTIPTAEEVGMLSELLVQESVVPDYVLKTIDNLPLETHPMTQFIVGITALQNESAFSRQYRAKLLNKATLWKEVLGDGISMLAKIIVIAASIYRRSFKDGILRKIDPSLDWAANFAQMLGYDTPEFYEIMRLYLFLHSDHEGGNVSEHSSSLVGSTLADPYLCAAAGMAGLAGPLHGLANQECLTWLLELNKTLNGATPSEDKIREIAKATLGAGNVIPGFGHAVLRKTDPRFSVQYEFCKKRMPDFDLFKLLSVCVNVIPDVLLETGKVQNPYPNVDCHSGVLLSYYGLTEQSYYTVLFGVSRCIGILSQLVWARALLLPIERPKSICLDQLMELSNAATESTANN